MSPGVERQPERVPLKTAAAAAPLSPPLPPLPLLLSLPLSARPLQPLALPLPLWQNGCVAPATRLHCRCCRRRCC